MPFCNPGTAAVFTRPPGRTDVVVASVAAADFAEANARPPLLAAADEDEAMLRAEERLVADSMKCQPEG